MKTLAEVAGLTVGEADRVRTAAGDLLGALPPTHQRWLHNVVAHPLLELAPALGEWLHAHTDPEG